MQPLRWPTLAAVIVLSASPALSQGRDPVLRYDAMKSSYQCGGPVRLVSGNEPIQYQLSDRLDSFVPPADAPCPPDVVCPPGVDGFAPAPGSTQAPEDDARGDGNDAPSDSADTFNLDQDAVDRFNDTAPSSSVDVAATLDSSHRTLPNWSTSTRLVIFLAKHCRR